MNKRYGFTLIEVMVIAVIVVILAEIAVPNFMDAQVRAKVSRAKADMRICAAALEAYRVDWINYIPCGSVWNASPSFLYWYLNYPLSTPVAYISKPNQLKDPFREPVAISIPTYRYVNTFEHWGSKDPPSLYFPILESHYMGDWLIWSIGPDLHSSSWGGTQYRQSWGYRSDLGYPVYPYPYDPTNGTVSEGDIHRTQKHDEGELPSS